MAATPTPIRARIPDFLAAQRKTMAASGSGSGFEVQIYRNHRIRQWRFFPFPESIWSVLINPIPEPFLARRDLRKRLRRRDIH